MKRKCKDYKTCLACGGTGVCEGSDGISNDFHCPACDFQWWFDDSNVMEYILPSVGWWGIKYNGKPDMVVHGVPEGCLLVLWERKLR